MVVKKALFFSVRDSASAFEKSCMSIYKTLALRSDKFYFPASPHLPAKAILLPFPYVDVALIAHPVNNDGMKIYTQPDAAS